MNAPTSSVSTNSTVEVDGGVTEILHHLIHAVDSIEKRLARLDGPMFPSLNERVNPVVRPYIDRFKRVLGRTGTAISGRLPRFRREQPGLKTTLQIGHEVTELRDEVRSLREAMEVLAKKS